MTEDHIDQLLEDWKRERPDLDASAMGILGRITVLGHLVNRGLEEVLRPRGLTVTDYYVLGVLRRCGPPYHQPIKVLCARSLLSSGAMTNRADRLEEKGLVERRANPDDRRGVLLALTESGRELVDRVAPERFREAQERVSVLSPKDRLQLEGLLKKFLAAQSVESVKRKRTG